MDLSAKVLQHSELTRLSGCLEHHHRQPKDVSKTVRECCVEVTLLVKKAHISGTLSGFNYQLKCSSVYPRLALFYQLIYDAFLKRASMFLSQLKLNLKPPVARHFDDVSRAEA